MFCSYESEIDRLIRLSERNELVKHSNRYIERRYIAPIKRISKKLLRMINSKARTVKRLQRARESHRKKLLEEDEEE